MDAMILVTYHSAAVISFPKNFANSELVIALIHKYHTSLVEYFVGKQKNCLEYSVDWNV